MTSIHAIAVSAAEPRALGRIVGLSAILNIVAQLGDLFESFIKRAADVKDSGSIVPGHGGMLDRIDALILTSAAVYLYTLWMRPR